MKPAAFEYVAAGNLDEAIAALDDVEARPIAGGQSLVPLMNLRLATPATLVDLNAVLELDHVTLDDGMLVLGALCRHRRLETDSLVRERAPLLSEAASHIGHAAIRNRGTLGGSLAHGDPAAELGAALVALGGHVRARSNAGTRDIAAGDLFTGFFSTSLRDPELVVDVVVPAAEPHEGSAFLEVAPRHGDFAVAGVAARVVLGDDGVCIAATAAACGVAATPVDLTPSLEGVRGERELSDAALRDVGAKASRSFEPVSDLQASADDRRELTALLSVDVLRRAWDRARSGRR